MPKKSKIGWTHGAGINEFANCNVEDDNVDKQKGKQRRNTVTSGDM
jgi:hypothetical protein